MDSFNTPTMLTSDPTRRISKDPMVAALPLSEYSYTAIVLVRV